MESAFFAVATALAGFATSVEMPIGFRALQGIGNGGTNASPTLGR